MLPQKPRLLTIQYILKVTIHRLEFGNKVINVPSDIMCNNTWPSHKD